MINYLDVISYSVVFSVKCILEYLKLIFTPKNFYLPFKA